MKMIVLTSISFLVHWDDAVDASSFCGNVSARFRTDNARYLHFQREISAQGRGRFVSENEI